MSTILIIIAIAIILFIAFKVFKLITRIILIFIFLALAYFTNPGIERHENAVKKRSGGKLATLIPGRIVVKDLQVASITQVKSLNGDTKNIGIGMFTQVFIFRDPN